MFLLCLETSSERKIHRQKLSISSNENKEQYTKQPSLNGMKKNSHVVLQLSTCANEFHFLYLRLEIRQFID